MTITMYRKKELSGKREHPKRVFKCVRLADTCVFTCLGKKKIGHAMWHVQSACIHVRYVSNVYLCLIRVRHGYDNHFGVSLLHRFSLYIIVVLDALKQQQKLCPHKTKTRVN